jgi:enoyl-CoA hydratase/carnithine racemase
MRGADVVIVPAVLTPETVEALATTLERLHTGGRGVLVLRGAAATEAEEPRFCEGMARGASPTSAEVFAAHVATFARTLHRLATTSTPTVAMVDGRCLGGGLALACVCDWVVASDRARFGLPELTLGLQPEIVGLCLATRASPGALRHLALRASSVDASEAMRLGLVDETGSTDSLEGVVEDRVRRLLRLDAGAVASFRTRWWASLGVGPGGWPALEEAARRVVRRLAGPGCDAPVLERQAST